jgi:hypothetical protein
LGWSCVYFRVGTRFTSGWANGALLVLVEHFRLYFRVGWRGSCLVLLEGPSLLQGGYSRGGTSNSGVDTPTHPEVPTRTHPEVPVSRWLHDMTSNERRSSNEPTTNKAAPGADSRRDAAEPPSASASERERGGEPAAPRAGPGGGAAPRRAAAARSRPSRGGDDHADRSESAAAPLVPPSAWGHELASWRGRPPPRQSDDTHRAASG